MFIPSDDGNTILVVDDLDEGRCLVCHWLRMHGYRAIEAVNGQEAVEIALRERPSLILMDISMPQLDGFGAMRRIRADEQLRDVPIVAVSAYDKMELYGAALDAGCNEFVPKPLDPEKLTNLLSRLLPKN
jgi:two-component system cell cycle response regulator DivK